VLAIDGGNSKTDVALVAADGRVLGSARGPGFRPSVTGLTRAVESVADTVGLAFKAAGRPMQGGADHVAAYTANVDLPAEEAELHRIIAARGWGTTVAVGNDTLALLRAGAAEGWGVAVVCGSGINCVGVDAAGHVAGFAAIGRTTGDWGGGHFLGEEMLWHAVRGEEGRGPATAMTPAVALHFGLDRAIDVGLAVHTGQIPEARLGELTPSLFEVAAAGDAVARSLVDRLAEEVFVMSQVIMRRLDLLATPTEVVLGGGVLAARHQVLMDAIDERFRVGAPHTVLTVVSAPPVLGAALLGLDRIDAPQEARSRLRSFFG
jgi:N-acetylglucosamine kinase-like BadF-type ATPase